MNNTVNSIISVITTRFKHNITEEEKKTVTDWVNSGATEKMVTEALATTYNNINEWNIRYTNRVIENMVKDGINDSNLNEYKKKHSHSQNKNVNASSDKVTVVRCKNCKQGEHKNGRYYDCSVFKRRMWEDDYCSLGRSKT